MAGSRFVVYMVGIIIILIGLYLLLAATGILVALAGIGLGGAVAAFFVVLIGLGVLAATRWLPRERRVVREGPTVVEERRRP